MKHKKQIISRALFLLLTFGGTNSCGPIYELNEDTASFVPHQSIPEGLASLKAKECGRCHEEIYKEWKKSLHSKAYVDPFFLAYLRKDEYEPSCLVCHTPLQNQYEKIITFEEGNFRRPRIRENPQFDPELRDEGVTCAACHVRDGIILGPYEIADAPHPTRYDPLFLSKKLCLKCHQVPSRPFSMMESGICSTGEEMEGGIWDKKGYICQDCHMERITRPLVEDFGPRPGGRHNWPGAYSKEQLQKAFEFTATKRSENSVRVNVRNVGAGHKVPTGDPDRYITLKFLWRSESGNEELLKELKFRRVILWKPIIIELSDNRLAPGEAKSFRFKPPTERGELIVRASYHIMTDWSFKRLKRKYGLTGEWEIHRPFLEKKVEIR